MERSWIPALVVDRVTRVQVENTEPNLVFRCRQCGWTRELPRSLDGKRGRCKACGSVQRIEATSAGLGSYPLVEEPEIELRSMLVPALAEPQSTRPKPERKAAHLARWRRVARAYGGEASHIQGMAVCLLALSVADLFMTYTLLRAGPHFFEANPVAQWFFARWNMAGMALFKFGVMGGVIALGEVIERNRPGWGRFVLGVGCVAAAYAVMTGLRIYISHR